MIVGINKFYFKYYTSITIVYTMFLIISGITTPTTDLKADNAVGLGYFPHEILRT